MGLIRLLSEKDQRTLHHSRRVAVLSALLAKQLHIESQYILKAAALLHDIGKIELPDHILFENRILTEHDVHEIQHHTLYGEKLIRATNIPDAEEIAQIVRSSHEQFNGAGYPDHLSNVKIPLLARVLSVADCFDALTHARSYKPPLRRPDALKLMRCEGEKYDPEVLQTLLHIFGK